MNLFSNLIKKINKSNSNDDQKYSSNYSSNIYHEKQVKELCALHTLNNLFQEKYYTKTLLDEICVQLSPQELINPHRSVLGLGNYNINVIMKALQYKGFEAKWYDKRRPIIILNFDKIFGFILNVPSDNKIGGFISLPWKRNHWFAIARINNIFYNLDSKLDAPEEIGSVEDLSKYLSNLIKSKDKELFVIVTKEVESDDSWKNTTLTNVTSANSSS